jgi:hypothetical protein
VSVTAPARKIIEVAKTGERDPVRLRERALNGIGDPPEGDSLAR